MEHRRAVMNKGVISLSDELVIASGYTFEQFRNTRYFKGQDPKRVFWLDEKLLFQGYSFMVSLFFRNGVIYMLSLLCCDKEFGMREEKKRKELHDGILQSWGIVQPEHEWGYIKSVYDPRSNISSIDIVFSQNIATD